MATHKVKASMSVVELTKASTSMSLEIYADESKIGTIELGKGSIAWKGAHRQSFKRMNWSEFASIMDKLHYPEDE